MNRLVLNDNKTEVLLSGSARSLRQLEPSDIHMGDYGIHFLSKVKNLGIHFDRDLSSASHVNTPIETNLELRELNKIHLINTDCSVILVLRLVLSTLDYCNSLLAGPPRERLKGFQTMQNNAALLFRKKIQR